ncbi:zinc finger protein odd-paired-like (opl) [Fusarium bulbicola]|nr:zinc finger protein odd-paired-like (opl) [Fusarium bulbicola]
MQFDSEWFDMDDTFNMCGQLMACLSETTNLSSTSSAFDPFASPSQQSTRHQCGIMDCDEPCNFVSHRAELTPLAPEMGKFGPIEAEEDQMSVSDPFPEALMKYSPDASMRATSFATTPIQSLPGPVVSDTGSLWSCVKGNPISLFPNKQSSSEFDSFNLDRHSWSLCSPLHSPELPDWMQAQRQMTVDIQQKSVEEQGARSRPSRERSIKPDSVPDNVVSGVKYNCDYSGCQKSYKRREHLKRHKQTSHVAWPNHLACEFCGKDQFSRKDNLNTHRRLHTRPTSCSRRVQFIPAAVPVINQEKRSKEQRLPSDSRRLRMRAPPKASFQAGE